jgi:hypothetical protein
VWNERTVYRVCSRNGVCVVPDIHTLLERRGVYRVSERPILEWNGVYRMYIIMRQRNLRDDGMYVDDEPRMLGVLTGVCR